jgi:hypothetical protein
MKSAQRVGTADNDVNAIRSMGMIPQGYVVNNFLTIQMRSTLSLMCLMYEVFRKITNQYKMEVTSKQET